MYCVIQKIQLKKQDQHGFYRELVAKTSWWGASDKPPLWMHAYGGERFERPRLDAYRISLHQSYREDGKVKKRQYSICTMSYYTIVEFSLFDCAEIAINNVSEQTGIDPRELYDLIEQKLNPLREQLEADFRESEEYQTHQKHLQIIKEHDAACADFCQKYNVPSEEYDRCYDVFGTLRNPEYLKHLKQEHKARQQAAKEAKRRQRQEWQKWEEAFKQFGSGAGASGDYGRRCAAAPSRTYTADETAMLKQFYRLLSKTYHPDLNPGKDTTAEMQMLNRLKTEWGI